VSRKAGRGEGRLTQGLEAVKKSTIPVILSADSMILRLTTLHENGSVEAKSFIFNGTFRYFHGSRSCPSAGGHPETMKMAAVPVVGPRRCLGPGAMHRIAPTICQAAIFKAAKNLQLFVFKKTNAHASRSLP
jgi:hypothetical protein